MYVSSIITDLRCAFNSGGTGYYIHRYSQYRYRINLTLRILHCSVRRYREFNILHFCSDLHTNYNF